MAQKTWIGNAPLAQQVTQWAFGGTWETDDVINLTIGSKTVSTTTGNTTTATVVSNLVTTWNNLSATSYPEFAEMTASANTTTFILTMDSGHAGKPFTVTIATTEAGGGAADAQTIDGAATGTGTTTTANSGPNVWGIASNWLEGAVPADSDTVVFDRGNVDLLYDLEQNKIEPTLMTITQGYTGSIGLPTRNSNGYEEYRGTHLTVGPATLNIGTGFGSGSGRIKINSGSDPVTLNVYATGTSTEQGVHALNWKGTHASNVLNVYGGDVGIAMFSGETAVVATLRQNGGTIESGTGLTWTTINKAGGTLITNAAATTITNDAGDLTCKAGAHTTINLTGGTLYYESSGTITTLAIYDGATADFRRTNLARTVTNCTVTSGGSVFDRSKTVTWTNGIDLYQCGNEDVTIEIGKHFTLTPSAI